MCHENLDWFYVIAVYFRGAHGALRPQRSEEAKMPIKEQKLQAELNGMQLVAIDHSAPTACDPCVTGVINLPPALVADVVNVEL
jgi:hypothetical protein